MCDICGWSRPILLVELWVKHRKLADLCGWFPGRTEVMTHLRSAQYCEMWTATERRRLKKSWSHYRASSRYICFNGNCNWGTCIAPPTRRLRAYHRVSPYPGACRQNETEMFSDHDETSPSIAAVSAPSAACFMLAVQQQKSLCRQFVDVSTARRGCHTMKCAM